MCRNIKSLFNFDPPATIEEIEKSSLQYVRKVSGFNKPSIDNERVFNKAVEDITSVSKILLEHLSTKTRPKNRDVEIEKIRQRNKIRYDTEQKTTIS